MTNFFSLFILALALSADTFSMCLALGTTNPSNKDKLKLSFVVGLMHFFMPLLGELLGQNIIALFSLNSNKFLGGILIFIACNLLVEIKNKKDISPFEYNLINILIFAFGVSLDAFSTGLGIGGMTTNLFLATSLFSLVSFIMTYLGLYLGGIAYKHLEKKASILGVLLLLGIGCYHLCQ